MSVEDMVDDLRRLVLCESPSADLSAVARSAEEVAAVGSRLMGTEPDLIVLDGCTHVRWRLGTGSRKLLLLGHHDTVWPRGTLRRMPWSVSDGVARGPGCFDMKAGLVQMFYALALARPDGVTVLITGDEELGAPTSGGLIEDEARWCGAVLVAEPSGPGGTLKIARKGAAHFTMTVKGRAAHAGLDPELGVNALVETAHQIPVIAALSAPDLGTTVTPTMLSAGTAGNTVPDTARLTIDTRAETPAEQQRVRTALAGLRPHLLGSTVDVVPGPSCPPLQADPDLVLAARSAYRALGFGELGGVTVGGASDGNRTAGIGVPTVDGLGAVGGGAHGPDEHVVIAEMPRRAAFLARLMEWRTAC